MTLPRLYFVYKDILVYNEDGTPKFPTSNAGENHLPWFVTSDSAVSQKLKLYGVELPYVMNFKNQTEVNQILHLLAHNEADRFLDNSQKNIVSLTYKQGINTPELDLIYPIVLFSDQYFYKQSPIKLPEEFTPKIKQGKFKVLFIVPTEGWFSLHPQQFVWLYDFAKLNNLTRDQLVVINPNYKSKTNYYSYLSKTGTLDFLTIFEFDYFRYSLWFYEGIHMLSSNSKEKVQKEFEYNLKQKLDINFTKHFLCLNRALRPHRVFIFTEIMSNPKLRPVTDLSMSPAPLLTMNFKQVIHRDIKSDYKHSKLRLLSFLETYDQTKPLVFDVEDIDNNNPANKLNIQAHLNTFVNIVTETFHFNDSIFFTEKIYKPILAAQPFVLVSSPFMLRKMHEFGFKTFSHFWDESYDSEEDYTRRMEKVVDTLEYIASWDLKKCKEVYLEMVPILEHNIKIVQDTSELENIHNQLCNFPGKD